MQQTEYVVLVDEKGSVLGTEEKISAHKKGLLHRAFSVFVFNKEGKMLLQQRAYGKYHFGGLWSNTCCSHPRLGEDIADAAHRRLLEELNFDTELKEVFTFLYRAEDAATQLIEHELDTVFVGFYDGEVPYNPSEVNAVKWISVYEVFHELEREGDSYTYWFKTALGELKRKGLLSAAALQNLFETQV